MLLVARDILFNTRNILYFLNCKQPFTNKIVLNEHDQRMLLGNKQFGMFTDTSDNFQSEHDCMLNSVSIQSIYSLDKFPNNIVGVIKQISSRQSILLLQMFFKTFSLKHCTKFHSGSMIYDNNEMLKLLVLGFNLCLLKNFISEHRNLPQKKLIIFSLLNRKYLE